MYLCSENPPRVHTFTRRRYALVNLCITASSPRCCSNQASPQGSLEIVSQYCNLLPRRRNKNALKSTNLKTLTYLFDNQWMQGRSSHMVIPSESIRNLLRTKGVKRKNRQKGVKTLTKPTESNFHLPESKSNEQRPPREKVEKVQN